MGIAAAVVVVVVKVRREKTAEGGDRDDCRVEGSSDLRRRMKKDAGDD